jgi:hypothetical protein
MGRRRADSVPPMRLPTLLLIAGLLAFVPLGCGDSSEDPLPAVPIEQGSALKERVRSAFQQKRECKPPQGASRWGCSVGAYRCQGVVAGRGWSISCSKPGESIAFLIRRD